MLFLGQVSTSLISGVGMLILVAYLQPSDFGLVAAALLVIGSIQAALNLGFGPAVQALGPLPTRDQTALTMAIGTGFLVATTTFVAAPLAMALLAQPDAVDVLRALTPVLVLSHWTSVRKALIERELRYGSVAAVSAIGALGGVAAGLVLVTRGAGAWALVVQMLVAETIRAVGHLVIPVGPRRPGWDREGSRELWRFGRQLVRNNIYIFIYSNFDDAVVSRLGGASALGVYNLAYRAANLPTQMFTHTSQRLMLPLLSSLRRSGHSSGSFYLGQLRILSLIVGLFMFGLLFHGDAVLATVYGGSWSEAGPVLKILALYGLFRSIGATTGAVFLSSERPELVASIAKWQTISMVALIVPAFWIGGLVGAALAVTAPLVTATIIAVGIASPMVDVGRRIASTAIAGGWMGAFAANTIGWFARISLDGWGALLAGGAVTVVSFIVIALGVFGRETRMVLAAARHAGGRTA